MNVVSTEVIVLGIFLLINLVFGLYHARNVKTIEDYALGGRNFSTSALVSTIIATWIGGDYLFITLAEVYKTGLHYTIGCLGMVVCLFLNAYIFIPNMKEFLGNLSVAEAMGNLYGKKIRIISAICGTIASAGFIAVQFKVFGEILKTFVGVSGNSTIILSALIVIIYSTLGGIKSVAFTDIVQFFTFGVLIPVLGFIVWNDFNHTHGLTISESLNHPIFNYENFIGFNNPNFWSLVLLFLLFSLPDLNPTMFQRVSMGRNVRQVKQAFSISAFVLMFILLGMAWIGFLLHSINPNLEPNNLVEYIITHYSKPWLRSFILIGVIAMCMSTADSNLNSSSVLLTHDLLSPLNIRLKNELVLSKFISILLGVASIFLALLEYDLLPLVFMTQSFYIPIVDVPLILAIIGFRTSTKSVLIGMSAGLLGVIIWRIFFMDITNVDSILPGMVINFLFLIGSHYLLDQPGGWLHSSSKTNNFRNKNRFLSFIQNWKEFSISEFLKADAPKNELSYTGLGIFSLASTFCSMYSAGVLTQNEWVINLYEIMLFISISFITYPLWPFRLKKDIFSALWWYLGIFSLVSSNTVILLLSEFSHIQFTIFLLSMIVVTIVAKWQTAFTLIGSSIYGAIYFFKTQTDIGAIDSIIEYNRFLLYSCLLVSTVVIIFLRPKRQSEEISEFIRNYLDSENKQKQLEVIKLSKYREEFISRLDQECIEVFRAIHHQIYDLINNLHNKKDKTISDIEERERTIMQITEKLKAASDYLNSIISSIQNKIKINTTATNIEMFIQSITDEYILLYNPKIEISTDFKNNIKEAVLDQSLIKKVFFEVLNFLNKYFNNSHIMISLEESDIEYNIEKSNPFKIRRPAIKFAFIANIKGNKTKIEQQIHLDDEYYHIQKVILAHYGNIDSYTNIEQDKYIIEIKIPTNLQEIRPKKMDLIDEQIATIEEINNLITEQNKEILYKIAMELIKSDIEFEIISRITKLNITEIHELSDYIKKNNVSENKS